MDRFIVELLILNSGIIIKVKVVVCQRFYPMMHEELNNFSDITSARNIEILHYLFFSLDNFYVRHIIRTPIQKRKTIILQTNTKEKCYTSWSFFWTDLN
jgi:hypothetical protein